MSMFINCKNQRKEYVNLEKVSNVAIFFDKIEDGQGKYIFRIAFNFAHPIKVFGGSHYGELAQTQDYAYWDFFTEESFNEKVQELGKCFSGSEWIGKRMLDQENGLDKEVWVNLENVSNITFDGGRDRIIFNGVCAVSHKRNSEKLTTDHVYFDFDSTVEFQQSAKQIEKRVRG